MVGHVLISPVQPAAITALLSRLSQIAAMVDAGTMTPAVAQQTVADDESVALAFEKAFSGRTLTEKQREARSLAALYAANTITTDQYVGELSRVATEPERVVTVKEIRDYLRLPAPSNDTVAATLGTINDEDALLRSLIDSATQYLQDLTNRQFLTATWQLTMSAFPGIWTAWAPPNVPIPQIQGVPWGYPSWTQLPESMEIELPFPPLQAVTAINYVDTTGMPQTLSPSLYQVDTTTIMGRVAPAYGQVWPVAQLQYQSVVITYTCGYGDRFRVPADLVRAIKALAALSYSQRDAAVNMKLADVPYSLQAIFQKYKVRRAV